MAGVAGVDSDRPGILAGFALHHAQVSIGCLSASVGWLDTGGGWDESPEIVAERLATAAGSEARPVDAERLHNALTLLAAPIRSRLATTRGRHWVSPYQPRLVRHLIGRMNELIHRAARRRQRGRLLRLERALELVAGGHTAGEALLVERLALAPEDELETELDRIPYTQRGWGELQVRITGVILFLGPSSLSPTEGGE
ncbi:MAG TPA: hypothetical protein VFU40_03335 [Gemmatimonadales bacterium]|nr:hypothetical protein [Gemmatimonadales bacterium]